MHLLLSGALLPLHKREKHCAPSEKEKLSDKNKRRAHTSSDWERSTLFIKALRSTSATCPLGRDLKSGQKRTWCLAFLQAWHTAPWVQCLTTSRKPGGRGQSPSICKDPGYPHLARNCLDPGLPWEILGRQLPQICVAGYCQGPGPQPSPPQERDKPRVS